MSKLFYSAATRGFHAAGLGELPADAVPISAEQHIALLAAQEAGQEIVPDADGLPMARDRALPDPAIKARARRAAALRKSDWRMAVDGPMTAAERTAWADYRQALRDWPAQPGWPDQAMPTPPG